MLGLAGETRGALLVGLFADLPSVVAAMKPAAGAESVATVNFSHSWLSLCSKIPVDRSSSFFCVSARRFVLRACLPSSLVYLGSDLPYLGHLGVVPGVS